MNMEELVEELERSQLTGEHLWRLNEAVFNVEEDALMPLSRRIFQLALRVRKDYQAGRFYKADRGEYLALLGTLQNQRCLTGRQGATLRAALAEALGAEAQEAPKAGNSEAKRRLQEQSKALAAQLAELKRLKGAVETFLTWQGPEPKAAAKAKAKEMAKKEKGKEKEPEALQLKQCAVEIAQVVEKTYVKNVEVRGLPRDRQNSEPNSQDFGNTEPYGTVLSYLTFGVYGCEIFKKSNELYLAKDVYVTWNGDPTTWGDYLRKVRLQHDKTPKRLLRKKSGTKYLLRFLLARVHYPLNRLEVNLLDNDQVLIILEELLRDPGKGDLESQRRPGDRMPMRKSQKADEQFSQRLPLLLEETKEICRKAQLSLILALNFPDSRRTSRRKPTKETMVIGDGRDPGGVVANINGALISGVAVVMILIQKIQTTTMIPTYHGTS
ncbi:unnamed protein product [Effrenium voratum]|nr:unnamed protein product [Effrenium voratum]